MRRSNRTWYRNFSDRDSLIVRHVTHAHHCVSNFRKTSPIGTHIMKNELAIKFGRMNLSESLNLHLLVLGLLRSVGTKRVSENRRWAEKDSDEG